MANVVDLRQVLVEQLKREGSIRSSAVEHAFSVVPRHVFVPQATLEQAYADQVVRIKESEGTLLSSCSQPAIIAEMLEQLAVSQGDRILEIGTGSGYTAALLASLTGNTGHVSSVDIEPDLVIRATEHLQTAGFAAVKTLAGEGALGDPIEAPFDRILLTVASADIAPAWWKQLAKNGRLVMPLSLKGIQKSVAFAQHGALLKSETMVDCGFIMLRGDESSETVHTLRRFPPVFLGADRGLSLNPAELAQHLLYEQPVETEVPMEVYPRELFSSLSMWLGFKEAGCCKVETRGQDSPDLPAITRRSEDYRFSIGLCAGNTVALLHLDKRLRVFRFGPDETLATRLRDRLMEWNDLGRPGATDLHIVAMRNGQRDLGILADADAIVARRHSTFCLMWGKS